MLTKIKAISVESAENKIKKEKQFFDSATFSVHYFHVKILYALTAKYH